MGNNQINSVFKHSNNNSEIIDCIKKMQSSNFFKKNILSENEEIDLLKQAKSNEINISKKAIDKLSRYFSKFAFNQAKLKFNSTGKKVSFEDLFAEANIGILLAIKNFRLEKWGTLQENGIKLRFSSYAQWWVKNTLNDYCLKNSSSIKFCTTKEDEKVFYNITTTLNKLKINKSCSDLNKDEITKVAKKLKVKNYNINKYIHSMNVSNSETDIENYFFESSLIKSKEEELTINSKLDTKYLLNKKEYKIFNYYLAGYGLEKIAEKFNSNKETIRKLIILAKQKLSTEKKII